MAITIRVDLASIPEELRASIQQVERQTLLEMSQIAHESALRGADVHTKTGALYQSTYNRAIVGGREVGHDPQRAPHALFVVFGTKPHQIRPRNRKALRWPSGGSFMFAQSVQHPGYAGDDYMERAKDDAVRQLQAIIERQRI